MNIALILAGGIGNRAAQQIPKQFLLVNNCPIIVHTLNCFEQTNCIDRICVVTLSEYVQEVLSYKTKYHITKLETVITGGTTGLHSLFNGLQSLKTKVSPSDLILIHDAVRPLITCKIIEDNIKIANKYGLAMAAAECTETLVLCDRKAISSERMVSREGLYRIQTPQTFRFSIIYNLLKNVTKWEQVQEPSAFALYMKQGGKIFLSPSNQMNVKITYPMDIELLNHFLEQTTKI